MGIAGPFSTYDAEGTHFSVTIKWRTPYVRRDKSPVSLKIKCGVNLAERCVIGMLTLDGMGPAVLNLHSGTLKCPSWETGALPLQRRRPTLGEQEDFIWIATHGAHLQTVPAI